MRFFLAASLVLLPGCLGYTLKMSSVEAPSACFWKKAHVELRHYPAAMRASDMGPRYSAAQDVFTLVMEGAEEGSIRRFPLRDSGESDRGHSSLVFAPDCHGLAVSLDGKTYRLVVMNDREAFLCDHVMVAAEGEGPWRRAPANRDIVQEILRSSTDLRSNRSQRNHTSGFGYGGLAREYGPELLGALRYAFAHSEEQDMRRAIVSFLMMPGEQTSISVKFLVSEAPALLDRYEDLRLEILAGLGRTESSLPGLVLSSHPDPKYQQVLAEALSRAHSLPISDSNCNHIAALTEALVVKTARMRMADALTVGILSRVAEDARCPLRQATSTTYREIWSIRGENTRIDAVKGLAASRTTASLAIVRKIANAPCLTYQRTTMGETDEVTTREGAGQVYDLSLGPEHITGSPVLSHSRLDLSCYARAALQLLERENADKATSPP